jgi:hypothetical protein
MSVRVNKKLIKNNKYLTKEEINESNDNEFFETNKNVNSLFEKSYYCINYSCSFLYKTVKIIIKISGVYLLWIFLHFCASYLYTKLCVPTTLLGLLMSPFLTATPHCQGLRWVIYNGANIINNMWIVVGTWLCANIMGLNNDSQRDN